MKLFHFSDTHGYHNLLSVPDNTDIIVFSGDESNNRSPYINEHEARDFLKWYSEINVKYKIFVAGNHSTAIEKGLISKKEINDMGIIYLNNESVVIEGLKIWGSPYSPTFGDWVFMRARHKMQELWNMIPEDVDIVITHTPPKGCLDVTYDRNGKLERVGCKSLFNRIIKVQPKLHLFGHVHSFEDILNAGVMKLANYNTIFSNGSVVTDRKFGHLTSAGNIFDI